MVTQSGSPIKDLPRKGVKAKFDLGYKGPKNDNFDKRFVM